MVLRSKREWHLRPTRAIDDKRRGERYALERFRENNQSLSGIRAQCFGVRRVLSPLLRGMEGEIRIENCLRSPLRCLKIAAR